MDMNQFTDGRKIAVDNNNGNRLHGAPNGDEDDTISEVVSIANAFRLAHDEDTRQVLNVQSSKKNSDAANLFFYVVAADWMRRSWPLLHGNTNDVRLGVNWREEIMGQIVNGTLLDQASNRQQPSDEKIMYVDNDKTATHRVAISNSSSDNEQDKHEPKTSSKFVLQSHILQKQHQQDLNKQRVSPKLRRNAQMYADYFLVGANAWLLLKQKFGYDIEICLRCQFVNFDRRTIDKDFDEYDAFPPSTESLYLAAIIEHDSDRELSANNNRSLSSNLNISGNFPNTTPILIPLSGRFRYEDYLSTKNTAITKTKGSWSDNIDSTTVPIRSRKPPRGRVRADNMQDPSHNITSTSIGNNISDDEDEDDNSYTDKDGRDYDVSPDDSVISSVHQQKSLSVILLPPSTTGGRNDNTPDTSTTYELSDAWLRTNHPDDNDNSNTNNSSTGGAMEDEYDYDDDNDDDKRSASGIVAGTTVATVVSPPRIRPYGSGLGNLGNTCFMNSTLQCLAHTEPLKRYFLSGEYELDLNRYNPLGTGGELAMQFARLLTDMYVVEPPRPSYSTVTRSTRYSSYGSSSDYLASNTNVVYPRSFKTTLGKHAEQFMGYDQHDSQELATYLLDALHEDTNRVTTKPYIEKPEQADNETDDEAAKKAWSLHLRREDSRVLENFMGLVKSRVECCEEGCGRVSTTFDPVMYLSVPIPGSSEREISVTYVPLEPLERPKHLTILLPKTATVEDLIKKVRAQIRDQYPALTSASTSPALEDLCVTDIWHNNIHSYLTNTEEVEKIRENDTTFVYELRPLKEMRQIFDETHSTCIPEIRVGDDGDAERLGIAHANRPKYYSLDLPSLLKLKKYEAWTEWIRGHFVNELSFANAFSPKKGSTNDRVKIYSQIITFLDECYQETEDANPTEEITSTGQKRTREEDDGKRRPIPVTEDEGDDDTIIKLCSLQNVFKSIRSKYDLGILELVATLMRKDIIELDSCDKEMHPNGIIIEICMRRIGAYPGEKVIDNVVAPFVIRISSDMTVYGLRQEIAKRLARSLRNASGRCRSASLSTGQSTAEVAASVVPPAALTERNDAQEVHNSCAELLVIRQIPLSFERKSSSFYRQDSRSHQLGSIAKPGSSWDGTRPISLASPSDDSERAFVSDYIGNYDRVCCDWNKEQMENSFDKQEYESVDGPLDNTNKSSSKDKTKTVVDCIDKFCQKEQLEETEQWYCNKCQKHVRAWKQFHIYKSPPHLIVHLKRFQYSPLTHKRNKINTLIDFPIKGLDLTGRVSHWAEDDNEKPVYDCYAVTNHYGGLGGGHYTAYALNPDGVWCLYDDSRISSHVDPKEVVSQAAYVLYYRRRDLSTSTPLEIGTPVVIAAAMPALIQNDPESRSHTTPSSEVSSCATSTSNVAMLDEGDDQNMDDNIPIDSGSEDNDDRNINISTVTSPLGSTIDPYEPPPSLFVVEHDYDDDSRHQDDHNDDEGSNGQKKKITKNRGNLDQESILPLQ